MKIRTAIPVVITFVIGLLWYFSLPDPVFDVPYSTVLIDRNGEMLGARVADDGQWRFPQQTGLPDRYREAVLFFEDKRFNRHPGVDPVAFGRAMVQNVRAGRVVSGGSTISMQVMRLASKNSKRSVRQKLVEMVQATRLEWEYSKDEILLMYASHAPFGGNVVGYEAAARRYFGRPADELSWAESALLAVLPNSPSLMHPGRNRDLLQEKRDRLLQRLHEAGRMDELTLSLALHEPIPAAPQPLPSLSPHLLDRLYSGSGRGKEHKSTLNAHLQRSAEEVIRQYHGSYHQNEIHNIAALITDTRTGEVLAYAGNAPDAVRSRHVDVVQSRRSTGSILKPVLYALMLDQGMILPNTLVADIPTQISEYAPQNFSRTYSGAVPASEVISRSLNVSSVRMLQSFGLSGFHNWLKELGITSLDREPDHYGLTLILGGAEASLWDITAMYASFGNHLLYRDERGLPAVRYHNRPLQFLMDEQPDVRTEEEGPRLGAGAVWAMVEAMREVKRPDGEVDWKRFESARNVAWKTGTSYGHRDAWAVGITPEYTIGVWVGNAGGEGRPGLTGVQKAAPVMFGLFNLMGSTSWFSEPVYQTTEVEVCRLSGHRAGPDCDHSHLQKIPVSGLETSLCPYHRRVFTDAEERHRLSSECASHEQMHARSWFVLPADMAWYYRRQQPSYRSLPSWAPGCAPSESTGPELALIYPGPGAAIYIPLELDGTRGKAVFEAAHQKPDTPVHWHLNGEWVGTTKDEHKLAVAPEPGEYTLTLVDETGLRLERSFRVLAR